MYYVRFRNGVKRWKIFGASNHSCRRRTRAKFFNTEEEAKQFATMLSNYTGQKAKVSGPVNPYTGQFTEVPMKEYALA